jgi:hypothetical protein
MHHDELNDIERHCSPYSILVVNSNKELVRLDCPFQVIVVLSIDNLQQGSIVTVTQVKVDIKLILVYVISNRAFHYWYFSIIL